MGNLNLKQMCGNDNYKDENSELDTIKERDLKVKNKTNIIITDHGSDVKDENPKSRLAKYFNHFKKKITLNFFLNKWRLENINFYLKGECYL